MLHSILFAILFYRKSFFRTGGVPGLGPIDPDPGANTLDRYRTGRIAECSDAFMYDLYGIV